MSQPSTTTAATPAKKQDQLPDLEFVGDGDMFQLLNKVSSASGEWVTVYKACEISGAGCVVQVTTLRGGHVAEALTYAPGTKIVPDKNGGRMLVGLHWHPPEPGKGSKSAGKG